MSERSLDEVIDDYEKVFEMDAKERNDRYCKLLDALKYVGRVGWNTEQVKAILEGKDDS